MAAQGHRSSSVPAGVRVAIAKNFDGDAQLYQAFADSCATQFAQDVLIGEASCDVGDLPALCRLAHNLKSALTMLGHEDLCNLAAGLEAQSAAGDLPSAQASWRVLRAALPSLVSP